MSLPTSIVIDAQLLDYTKKILDLVFDLLASKEETEEDRAALHAIELLKRGFYDAKSCNAGTNYMTYLSPQEFSILRRDLKPGRPLDEYANKFQIATHEHDMKQNVIIFQGTVDSPETMFRIGHWVGIMHQMMRTKIGDNYKIDPDWEDNTKNN